ncbi:hypothetical protein NE237_021906 [Protea cynaroides]|uniref:Uncharacterized protein n=1 Tax=Protea cynaroides TaxID=273540 RepID=A0A9Q0K3Q1_9MAGN|nr:hypothetical protein NE237_021906 [Protea cynaroides]
MVALHKQVRKGKFPSADQDLYCSCTSPLQATAAVVISSNLLFSRGQISSGVSGTSSLSFGNRVRWCGGVGGCAAVLLFREVGEESRKGPSFALAHGSIHKNIGLLINLKGYLLGNPVTDLTFDRNKIVPFCHGMGLIPDELYESLKRSCGGNYIQIEPTNVQCLKDMQSFHKCISGLNPYQILEPLCIFVSPKPKEMVGDRRSLSQNYYKILDPQPPIPTVGCRNYGYLLAYYWTNDIRVQNALHIQKVSIEKWQRCKYDLPYLFQVQSSIPYHAFLSKKRLSIFDIQRLDQLASLQKNLNEMNAQQRKITRS